MFFLIYLPSACVSFWGYKSVIGLLVSINLPILALNVIYTLRLFKVILPVLEGFVKRRMGQEIIDTEVEFRKSLLINDSLNDGMIENDVTDTETDKFKNSDGMDE